MAPKQKAQKMSLTEFINDESYGAGGSWADEMDDLPIGPSSGGNSGGYSRRDYGDSDRGYGNSIRGGDRDNYRGGRGGEDRYPARQALPIPDKAPYTAHIGNLSWDTNEGEIEAHFAACDVVSVRLVRDKLEDKPKGFGYVEFGTRDGLVKALDMSNSQLAGRNVRVSVADPPKDRDDGRTAGEWRRTGPLSPLPEPTRRGGDRQDRYQGEGGDRPERARFEPAGDGKVRDFGNWERKGPLAPMSPTPSSAEAGHREFTRRPPVDRPAGDRPATRDLPEGAPRREFRERPPVERQPTAAEADNQWRKAARPDPPAPKERSIPTSPVTPHTRPKLELKKRSEALPEVAAPAAAESASAKSNPFGAAKPIDAEARIREVEARRAALKKEQEEAEKKEAEEKKAKEEADKTAAAEKAEAEKAAAAAAPLKVDTEAAEKDKVEQPARAEGSVTSPRGPREFGNRGNFRNDRGDRGDRGERHDRGERAERAPRPAPGGGGAWRRAPERPAGQDRRQSRDDTRTEAASRDAGKSEPAEPKAEAEDGWSIATAKKGRGGSKAANS